MTSGPDATTTVLIVGIIVLLLGVRLVRMIRGTPYSGTRVAGFAGFMVAIFALTAVSSALILPIWAIAIDGALLVIVAATAAPTLQRRIAFERGPGGTWVYRTPAVVPIVYVGLFLARIGLEFVLLGGNPFVAPTGPGSVSAQAALVFGVVDALFAVSSGLIVAQAIAILRQYRVELRTSASRPDPSGP